MPVITVNSYGATLCIVVLLPLYSIQCLRLYTYPTRDDIMARKRRQCAGDVLDMTCLISEDIFGPAHLTFSIYTMGNEIEHYVFLTTVYSYFADLFL